MIPFEEAYRLVRDSIEPLDEVAVQMKDAAGFVLAEDVLSDLDMPPFDKSFRDGFAVRAEDIKNSPVRLRIIGESKAGKAFAGEVRPSEAVSIMTGAPVPKGADTVVMVEDTSKPSDDGVLIKVAMEPGSFIGRRGSDVKRGAKVLEEGSVIREAELAVLATVGKSEVEVVRKPTVSIIITGDELVGIDKTPNEWEIRDCNGPLLEAVLKRDDVTFFNLGIVQDRPDLLENAIEEGLKGDILLLSGGVSAGKYDYVLEILESLGVERVFHKVKQKPGKPLYFGRFGSKAVFGMPGNPVSTFYCYKVFVRAAIAKMMGFDVGDFRMEKGVLIESLRDKSRRKTFIPVVAEEGSSGWRVKPAGWHGSADVFGLSRSNAFAVLEEEVQQLEAGEEVEFFRW